MKKKKFTAAEVSGGCTPIPNFMEEAAKIFYSSLNGNQVSEFLEVLSDAATGDTALPDWVDLIEKHQFESPQNLLEMIEDTSDALKGAYEKGVNSRQ